MKVGFCGGRHNGIRHKTRDSGRAGRGNILTHLGGGNSHAGGERYIDIARGS